MTDSLSRFAKMEPKQDNKKDLKMTDGTNNLKATAGTKIGGDKQRGGGLKLFSDFKGVGSGTKKANKQAKKAV